MTLIITIYTVRLLNKNNFMKNILLITLLSIVQIGYSQIYGDITTDKRPVTKQIEYAVKSNYTGQIVFDIIVDEKGNVTVCNLNKSKTNIKSTPTVMKAKNRILMDLKFKSSSLYPEFHRGQVVIKAYK
jgi:hypothetical protein